jgi:pre-mRNA-processing factor SLU7
VILRHRRGHSSPAPRESTALQSLPSSSFAVGYRAKRDLEEARKSGVIPPEKDAATGEQLINPHIPEFMAKAPWYLNQSDPGLGHQRKEEAQRNAFGVETYYRRGEFSGQASSYRKGACRNCGSMTHAEKDCVERPRKVRACGGGDGGKGG